MCANHQHVLSVNLIMAKSGGCKPDIINYHFIFLPWWLYCSELTFMAIRVLCWNILWSGFHQSTRLLFRVRVWRVIINLRWCCPSSIAVYQLLLLVPVWHLYLLCFTHLVYRLKSSFCLTLNFLMGSLSLTETQRITAKIIIYYCGHLWNIKILNVHVYW